MCADIYNEDTFKFSNATYCLANFYMHLLHYLYNAEATLNVLPCRELFSAKLLNEELSKISAVGILSKNNFWRA